jgi:hypothetical protein
MVLAIQPSSRPLRSSGTGDRTLDRSVELCAR